MFPRPLQLHEPITYFFQFTYATSNSVNQQVRAPPQCTPRFVIPLNILLDPVLLPQFDAMNLLLLNLNNIYNLYFIGHP